MTVESAKKNVEDNQMDLDQDVEDGILRKAVYEKLSSYLLSLKIVSNSTLYTTTMSYVEKISSRELQMQPTFLEALRIIVYAAREISYSFKQSELSDLLTMAVRDIRIILGGSERNIRIFDQAIFSIYKDLIENYQDFNDSLKQFYPEILVDVISIIHSGQDSSGVKIGSYNAEIYYRTRKAQEYPTESVILDLSTSKQKRKPFAEEIILDKNLVTNLSRMTGRSEESLHEALKGLSEYDMNSIRDLCKNYNKLQKYYRLTGDEKEFREMAERELGRKLMDSQVQHAILSVKRSKTYVEYILDDKFIPDKSHGINHVKHNLEYGYQLIGIIQSKRKRKPRKLE